MHQDLAFLRDDAFHFPAFFYSADSRYVRKKWRLLLSQAWEVGTFQGALAFQQTQDVRLTKGDIVFEISSRGISRRSPKATNWWVSYSGDLRPYRDDEPQNDSVLRAQALMGDGLQNLWYAIGMIGKHADLPWLVGIERTAFFRNKASVLRLVASSLAYWLPELAFLSDRLTTSWDTPMTERCEKVLPEWVMKLCISFCMAGYEMPPLNQAWAGSFHQHLGDPTKFLLCYGLVEKTHEGRYRLADKCNDKYEKE